jgi:hypothetical protein
LTIPTAFEAVPMGWRTAETDVETASWASDPTLSLSAMVVSFS